MIGLVLPELPVLVHLGVGPGTHPPQERLIGNESIVVLRVAALLDQNVNLLALELLTKGKQNVLKLAQHHGGVQVQAAKAVSKVEHVHPGLALEVVDVKGKLS